MPNVKRNSKLVATLLTVALLLTGCEVPDISKFTEQSAEMTRGIRSGVKETEGRLRVASERKDLYSEESIEAFEQHLKEYRAAVKPTAAALDALDGYLEALNALARSNEKSGENAAAAVKSVSDLVNAVSGFTFAGEVVNISTGIATLLNQFKTSRDFKKRVTLAAEIVEGVHPVTDANGKQLKDESGMPVFTRNCTDAAGERIFLQAKNIKELAGPARKVVTDKEAAQLKALPSDDARRKQLIAWKKITKEQDAELKRLTPEERRRKLWDWKHLDDEQYASIARSEAAIQQLGCGVIDFLKFNIRDLREINNHLSTSLFDNVREKHQTLLDYHDGIVRADQRVQRELKTILAYKDQAAFIRESEATGAAPADILLMKLKLREYLTDIFIMDGPLRNTVVGAIKECGAGCGRMLEYVGKCLKCREEVLPNTSAEQFHTGNGHIESAFEARAAELGEQNAGYLEELDKIAPSRAAVVAELDALKAKHTQLDALLDSSLSALDAWAETHANLRVAVNKKKQLTVAKLAGKVRELWAIVNPETE